MSLANYEPILIEKLNNKVTLLHQNNNEISEVSGFFGLEESCELLEEYVLLRKNSRIPNIVRYTTLSSIAKKYSLYENNKEPDQLSRLVLMEVEKLLSVNRENLMNLESLIIGLQIIRAQYPLVSRMNEQGLMSIEQAALEALVNHPPAPPLPRDYPNSRWFVDPEPKMAENNFDFEAEQTKYQPQGAEKYIVISLRNLWVAGLSIFGLACGVWLIALSNLNSNTQISEGQINVDKKTSNHTSQGKSGIDRSGSSPVNIYSPSANMPATTVLKPLPGSNLSNSAKTIKPAKENGNGVVSTTISPPSVDKGSFDYGESIFNHFSKPNSSEKIKSSEFFAGSISSNSPENLIHQYYKDINNYQYRLAWNKLPLDLQQNHNIHPQGYQSFVEFFDQMASIQVNDLTVIEQNKYDAIVSAELNCQFKNNVKSPLFLHFFLFRDSQQWQISKIRLNPNRKSFCG
jgi:hypothetical protein